MMNLCTDIRNRATVRAEGRAVGSRGVCSLEIGGSSRIRHDSPPSGRVVAQSGAFTLIELLVVIGVIAILITLTVVAVAGIAKDANLASGTNKVTSALGTARALAVQRGKNVLVTFYAVPSGTTDQVIEIQFSERVASRPYAVQGFGPQIVDRFVPISGIEPVQLPSGIKVAGPQYGNDADGLWMASTDVPQVQINGEYPGVVLGVMFAPDGTLITQNSQSDSVRVWVDRNQDGLQRIIGNDEAPPPPSNPLTDTQFDVDWYQQRFFDDECFVSMAPFLAVYDDDEAREGEDDLTVYISSEADRIHFNRYTGVAMK